MIKSLSSGEARKVWRRIMSNPCIYPVDDDKPMYIDGYDEIWPEHSWSGMDPLPTEKDPPGFKRKRK